jgi:hypothetical protein
MAVVLKPGADARTWCSTLAVQEAARLNASSTHDCALWEQAVPLAAPGTLGSHVEHGRPERLDSPQSTWYPL